MVEDAQNRSRLHAYRPLILLLGLAALLIAAMPSVDQGVAALGPAAGASQPGAIPAIGVPGAVVSDELGSPAAPVAGGAASPTPGDPGSAAGSSGGGPVVGQPANGDGTNHVPAGSAPDGYGDTSHCVGDRQFGHLAVNPPCYRSFSGNNGGSTYRGVTGDTVKFLFFQLGRNDQVAAVFGENGGQGENEVDVYADAALRFLNEHYELYGRKVEFDVFESSCPETPPDVPHCIEEARRAMAEEPFILLEPTPLYPAVHDEFARNGFISIGGWHFDQSHFTQRRPYRWDVFMDGTQSMEVLAEFYCKEMAQKGATHSGRVIHPQVGPRGTSRKLGILAQEDDARLRPARLLAERVAACNGDEPDPVVSTYSTDIERAHEQAEGLAVKMIEERVTTVVCSCDSIAPVFLLPAFTAAGYYPEHLMPGTGTTDVDFQARLFDPAQWVHAFGLSHLGEPTPTSELDATKAFHLGGGEGDPCTTCVLGYPYLRMVLDGVQAAGPDLNPWTFEAGLLSLPDNGQQTLASPLRRFGPGDYTEWSDVKAVYWDPSAISKTDNSGGGAYITVSDARYGIGAIPRGLLDRIPPAAQ